MLCSWFLLCSYCFYRIYLYVSAIEYYRVHIFLTNFHARQINHPNSIPVVFVTTSSNCKYPVWVICCTISMLQEQINPASTHNHPFLNFLNNIGSKTPNGINIIIFSTNIACIWKVCPHVSNKTMLIAFLLPGSLHKKTTRKMTRMYVKKKVNEILCFIVSFFSHNQLTANTMHPLKIMAGIKYDTGCLKSWIIDFIYHLITNHLSFLKPNYIKIFWQFFQICSLKNVIFPFKTPSYKLYGRIFEES